MNNYELFTRNAEEVVTEQEVRELADDPADKRAYVGYEPSGVLHLGHLLTANKLIDLQEAGMDVVVSLADVHAYLNGKGSFEDIRDIAERMKAQFVAYGLDEDKTEYVYGSDSNSKRTTRSTCTNSLSQRRSTVPNEQSLNYKAVTPRQ